MTLTIASARQTAQDPLVITDHEGLVLEVNAPFVKVFGWSQEEIRGCSVTILLPLSFRDAHHLGFSRFQLTEISTLLNHPLQLKAILKSGAEILCEHYIMAEKQGTNWIFAALLRPLGAEK